VTSGREAKPRSEVLKMPMHRRLQGVRLYALPRSTAAAVRDEREARSFWLLSLREAAVRDALRHAELEACFDALRTAIERIPQQVEANLQATTSLAVEIGLAVAREVVGDVLDQGLLDPWPAVRRCLDEVTESATSVQIRLHPEDLGQVMSELEKNPAVRERVSGARFVPDPALGRAAVRIDTDTGQLRYDHREVLLRVSDQLRAAVVQARGPGLRDAAETPEASR
jgi:flagellar biosynthesis/type III secretory pathway protein FliH